MTSRGCAEKDLPRNPYIVYEQRLSVPLVPFLAPTPVLKGTMVPKDVTNSCRKVSESRHLVIGIVKPGGSRLRLRSTGQLVAFAARQHQLNRQSLFAHREHTDLFGKVRNGTKRTQEPSCQDAILTSSLAPVRFNPIESC